MHIDDAFRHLPINLLELDPTTLTHRTFQIDDTLSVARVSFIPVDLYPLLGAIGVPLQLVLLHFRFSRNNCRNGFSKPFGPAFQDTLVV